jgi:hypothetical protein
MATYNAINSFTSELLKGTWNFSTGVHTIKSMLVNSPAPAATNNVKADLTEIAAGNGYTAGGNALATSVANVSLAQNKASVTADVTITATGAMAAFRYIVIYDDTPTSPADPLQCWYDYGSSVSLANTETFTEDFDQTNGLIAVG